MADLTITAASVLADSAKVDHGKGGETLVAGKVVYLDSADNKYKLADSNSATVAAKSPAGITLNGGGNGQPMAVAQRGPVTLGAVLTPGVAYYLSDTPGGICPVADVGSGENAVLLGMAVSSSVLDLDIQNPGVTL